MSCCDNLIAGAFLPNFIPASSSLYLASRAQWASSAAPPKTSRLSRKPYTIERPTTSAIPDKTRQDAHRRCSTVGRPRVGSQPPPSRSLRHRMLLPTELRMPGPSIKTELRSRFRFPSRRGPKTMSRLMIFRPTINPSSLRQLHRWRHNTKFKDSGTSSRRLLHHPTPLRSTRPIYN